MMFTEERERERATPAGMLSNLAIKLETSELMRALRDASDALSTLKDCFQVVPCVVINRSENYGCSALAGIDSNLAIKLETSELIRTLRDASVALSTLRILFMLCLVW